ncbi:hypothetical protein [Comamonas sp. F1-6]|uniref:hypothetical protein n=1 Tax=Comamonas sp. F1-6 TaxID=673550 RepID=UPI0031D68ADF
MNSSTSTLTQWLDNLQILLPPSHITLVGAGNGVGAWVRWLQKQAGTATLVEADAQQFATLQCLQAAGYLERATLLNTVLAPEAKEPVEFFTASLASENGLLRPEELRQCWPNLSTLAVESLQAKALTSLLEVKPSQQWLLIDCLPAATLLHSAKAVLFKVDVVLARVLLGVDQPAGTGLTELIQALPDFIQLARQSTRHPAIVYVLFVRDYRNAFQRANQAKHEEENAKKAILKVQNDIQTKLAKFQEDNSELLKKQKLLIDSQSLLQTELLEAVNAKNTETVAKKIAQKAQIELQTLLDRVQASKAEQLMQQELQVQAREALKIDLVAANQALDIELKAKIELQAKYQQLDAEQQETKCRQQLLRKELIKAESQLNLLRDFLYQDEKYNK